MSDEHEGTEPTEEVGAEGCAPTPQKCEFKPGDIEETECPRFMEEIQDSFQPEPGFCVSSPDDGLPIPADEPSEAQAAPPFTPDHVVCVEDDREFVEIFDAHDELDPEAFEEAKYGAVIQRMLYGIDGKPRTPLRFDPSRVETICGDRFVRLLPAELNELRAQDGDLEEIPKVTSVPLPYVMVGPRRERCTHYKRQVISNDGQPDPNAFGHKIVFRNCMIRRSVGGAFMNIRDEAIYACDYRDPPDPRSAEKHLDGPDRVRLRSDDYKVKLPLFRSA